jgi:MFS family permease
MAAFGTGAVLATPLVSALSARLGRGRLVAISFTMLSLSVISFGLATELWVGILAMLAAGMAYLALIATLNTTVQLAVEEQLRGRVLAVYFMTFTAGYPLGSLLQGWLAEQVGLHATVAGAGVILLVISGALVMRPAYLHGMDGRALKDLPLEPAMT